MLIFIIIIFIFLLIFLVPIPLKFTAHYSKDRYYLKLYNIVIFSNTGGVLNKFLDKDAKIEKKTELISEGEPLYVKEGDVV